MAARLYIIPGEIVQPRNRRVPKYVFSLGVLTPIGSFDYGIQLVFLVGLDVTPAQHTTLTANADVFAFAEDLNTSLGGGNVNSAQAAHESLFIPAQFINGSMLYRELARIDYGMFAFMQRLANYTNIVIDSTTKLNVQWSAVPPDYQAAILQTATEQNMDTSFIAPNTQVRAIIKNFSDQWGDRPAGVGPVGF